MSSPSASSSILPIDSEHIDPITVESISILPRTTTIEEQFPIDSYEQVSKIEKDTDDDVDENDIDSLTVFDREGDLDKILDRARQEHIEQLSQQIFSQQPMNDTTARLILSQWNFRRVPTRTYAATSSFEVDTTEEEQQ